MAEDIESPAALDYLYNAADKLYMQFARSCGLSTCAYWMLYDLTRAGGEASLRDICDSWAYSKQTINSALKSLEGRGLIELFFCEGSRKNKGARLTDVGHAFTGINVEPAMKAERHAFLSLDASERATLLRLTRKYTQALEVEFREMAKRDDAAMTAASDERPGEGAMADPNAVPRPAP